MKTSIESLRYVVSCILILGFATNVNGQLLKKLGERAERAAERTIERRVERETQKKTDQVLDSILEPGSKKPNQERNQASQGNDPKVSGSGSNSNSGGSNETPGNTDSNSITVYSKFDFVPGDKLLFFDDFSNDFIGDFPSKWNTNGSGEVVTIGDSSRKWLKILPGYRTFYIPDVPILPEEYTIEFDILAVGLTSKTSSTATLRVMLSEDTKFENGNNNASISIPFCQYIGIGINVQNHINRKREINNTITADLRQVVLNQPHISIGVNKQRFRLWVNEKKYVDVPRLLPTGGIMKGVKFTLNSFKDGQESLFISNLKVAEGGLDLRRKLISEGRVSTNGILFDSGSANIQAQSMGIIRQIFQVLQQEKSMQLKIVGHTDTDGNDASNLELSKKRADAVKIALVSVYGVAGDRLLTEGKGESVPIDDNSTVDGKAQNRRVEFIKQ